MSAVLHIGFGNPAAIRQAKAGNVAYDRALKLGYSRTTAAQLARQAKREATDWEAPAETALRIVRPPQHSATRPYSGPTRPAA